MPAKIRTVLVAIAVMLGTLSALAATAVQAAWPERPVTVMVPFTAGGITDVLARLMSERLQEALKQPFIVENAPGAAGVIAAERVLKAAPDNLSATRELADIEQRRRARAPQVEVKSAVEPEPPPQEVDLVIAELEAWLAVLSEERDSRVTRI